MKTDIHFWSALDKCFLEWEMFQTEVVEKIKTHFHSVTFFSFENRAVYKIMWQNIALPQRSRMTVWRILITCWIPKATNISSVYLLLFHCNSSRTNTPQCYVIRTLSILILSQMWRYFVAQIPLQIEGEHFSNRIIDKNTVFCETLVFVSWRFSEKCGRLQCGTKGALLVNSLTITNQMHNVSV